MKKLFLIMAIAAVILMLPKVVYAQMGMMGSYNNASSSSYRHLQLNLDNITNALLKSQNVSSINQINCSEISQEQFEKVGDAWMGIMAGSEANHSAMEERMGGEGSETLKQAHIQMGENYLGCSNSQPNNWMPMMYGSGDEFSRRGYGYSGMMNEGLGWSFSWAAMLFWLVAFIDLNLLGIFLWKRIKK